MLITTSFDTDGSQVWFLKTILRVRCFPLKPFFAVAANSTCLFWSKDSLATHMARRRAGGAHAPNPLKVYSRKRSELGEADCCGQLVIMPNFITAAGWDQRELRSSTGPTPCCQGTGLTTQTRIKSVHQTILELYSWDIHCVALSSACKDWHLILQQSMLLCKRQVCRKKVMIVHQCRLQVKPNQLAEILQESLSRKILPVCQSTAEAQWGLLCLQVYLGSVVAQRLHRDITHFHVRRPKISASDFLPFVHQMLHCQKPYCLQIGIILSASCYIYAALGHRTLA